MTQEASTQQKHATEPPARTNLLRHDAVKCQREGFIATKPTRPREKLEKESTTVVFRQAGSVSPDYVEPSEVWVCPSKGAEQGNPQATLKYG